MSELEFNPSIYSVIDKRTGEEIDVSIFVEKVKIGGWQKAYVKCLAEYIKCAGGQSTIFLSYVIKNKDPHNMLYGTQREFAEKSGVSLPVISKTIKALEKKNLIKQVRSGAYMVSPELIRNGNDKVGVVLLRKWRDS